MEGIAHGNLLKGGAKTQNAVEAVMTSYGVLSLVTNDVRVIQLGY